jgi:hypothetical protein
MMLKTATTLCALALLLVTAGNAVAQDKPLPPFKAADYPIAVRKTLSNAVLECRQADGGKVTFAPDTVRKVDFNGDGRDDYVVSLEDTKCSTFESIFCGTGGCGVDFLVTMPDGSVRSLFEATIHKYEILGTPRKVRFWVHHGWCEGGGPGEACTKDIRITYKKFTPMPKTW